MATFTLAAIRISRKSGLLAASKSDLAYSAGAATGIGLRLPEKRSSAR